MCGIFGLIEKNGIHPDVLARMGSLIRHRGPDGEGFVLINSADSTALALGGSDTPIDAFSVSTNSKALGMIERAIGGLWNVGFGHRRLSIVDLSALGHQPMASTDGSLWITFNGEIYNHIELRAELEALGHCFTSHSDTEVILCAYRQWGVGCLSRFNGMWAFALHDLKLGKIFLARDRFGVKPLYFWRNGGSFAFASEIKAFLAHPDFSVRPSKTNLQSYLKDGPSEWDSATVFGGVHQLQASSYVLATPQDFLEGRFTAVRWWTVEPNSGLEEFDPSVADRLSDQYYELLRSAVELRLRADVPVGSALSGGLDSSSVVYLIAQRIKDAGESRSQETFSSVYRGLGTQHCDESPFIETVGRLLNVHMNTIEPRPEDVPEEHARMIWCMDVPPESTCMSGWHTFKLVNSRGIKVTLDGQGADEQLAGYLSYLAIALAPSGLASVLQLSKLTRLHPRRVAIGAVAGAMISRLASSTPVRRLFSGRRARVLSQ
ncbi:MAG TPA: asparagine synthase (glutamine-hydrolyzing), partial [Alicycliphilus sp.]|nr:asparagine synthase (glutamine-hydrolyzing) [Alicycliphilus sp.]